MQPESQRGGAREAMRTRLLDAATQVIDERGLAGATIREIAKAAGVAEGSVYNHFTGKIDLISTVFLERMPKIRLRLAVHELSGRIGKGDPVANLVDFALATVDAYRELDAIAGALTADQEVISRLREALTRLDLGPGRAHRAVAAYLRLEEDQGRLALAATPEIVGAALLGGCHEYAFMGIFHQRSPFEDDPGVFASGLVGALARHPQ